MKVNTANSNGHRQLLMRCQVTNQHALTSERFVDHAEFDMWRYLVEQKHGLAVTDPSPCVWVPNNECRRHDKLFSHAAFQAAVVKLSCETYVAQTGIIQRTVRFAR